MNVCHRIFFVSTAAAFLFASSVFAGDGAVVARENGVLENTQVALLLLSGFVFMVQSFSIRRTLRFIPWMGAWLSPSIILRELDVEKLAVPQWFIWIGSGMGRNLIMGFGWIALCVLAIRSYSEWKGSFGRIARSRAALLAYSSVATLLVGSLFDHGSVPTDQGMFWEEAFETVGYFLLFLAALLTSSIRDA